MIEKENLKEFLISKIKGEIAIENITRLTAPGDNYLSLILSVNVKCISNSEDTDKILHLVVKLAPPALFKPGATMRPLTENAFRNELAWYGKVVPFLKEFEVKCGVKGYSNFYARFYGARLSSNKGSDVFDKDAMIVLQRLDGYENVNRLIGFNFETSKDILKTLSRFHALTIALRKKHPQMFQSQILPFINNRHASESSSEFSPCIGILDIIKEKQEFTPYLRKFERALNSKPHQNPQRDRFTEPWGTTAHSDFWINNIMVQKSGNNNAGAKVKFLDFQSVMYRSFAVDVVFFLLASVETSVQKTRIDKLIRYYYDEFIDNLRELKVNSEIYTYESYIRELEIEAKKEQFYHAMMFVSVILAEKENIPDFVMNENMQEFLSLWNIDKTPTQKEKIWTIAQVCAERNWI